MWRRWQHDKSYPRRDKGMKQSPADNKKMKPGNQDTVAAYKLLKMAVDTLLVKLSRKDRQANRAPAKERTTHVRGSEVNKFNVPLCSDEQRSAFISRASRSCWDNPNACLLLLRRAHSPCSDFEMIFDIMERSTGKGMIDSSIGTRAVDRRAWYHQIQCSLLCFISL